MDSSNLNQVVQKILEKVSKHRQLYEQIEEAVKQQILIEIFEALSWNWKNPEEVRPEEKTSSGRADYALIINGRPIAFVEAKSLKVNVIKDLNALSQLGKYCFDEGVEYGILTNGIQWRVIKSFEKGKNIKERTLLSIDLENESLEKSVVKLNLLHKARISDIEELAKLLRQLEQSYNKLKQKGFNEEQLLSFLRQYTSSHKDLPEGAERIEKLTNVSYTKPRALYVKDYESWIELTLNKNTWRETVITLVRYLLERGIHDIRVPKYIEQSPLELMNKGKKGSYRTIGNWHIEVWLSANEILGIIKKLQNKTNIQVALKLESYEK